MKKLLFLSMLVLSGCSFQRIGNLTMVSTRNIDTSTNYVELKRNVSGTSKMRKGDALQEAIDEAVNSVPGGEYLMNTVVYVKDNRIVKVTGDVYGRANPNEKRPDPGVQFNRFDPVIYTDEKGRTVKATVLEINGEEISIALDHNQKKIVTNASRIKLR